MGTTGLLVQSQVSKDANKGFQALLCNGFGQNHFPNDKWKNQLPNITLFYAVKCNPYPSLLAIMSALGANFDSASPNEIDKILSLGVSPDRIIYSNPCKAESHIRYAASVGVNLATFDSREEIKKIKNNNPMCELLIRIKVDDSGSKFPLGMKFGALENEFAPLLLETQGEGLKLRGVSFHVGSLCSNPNAYGSAIALARSVFDLANRLGLPKMDILNIGGGFTNTSIFDEAATIIDSSIKEYFKEDDMVGLKVIAEPGRYFAATPFTFATTIIGKRVRGEVREYWINDGIFGSLRMASRPGEVAKILIPFASESGKDNTLCEGADTYRSNVFGPTCDSQDIVLKDEYLPELEMNDWVLFKDMGAYRAVFGSSFNGFVTSDIKTHMAYYFDDNATDWRVSKN